MKPDSVLARTAREVMEAHAGGAGPRAGMTICPACSQPLPCSSGRAAAEVIFAAGLAESSGLIDIARGGRGMSSSPGPPDAGPPAPARPVSHSRPGLHDARPPAPARPVSHSRPDLAEESDGPPSAGSGPDVDPLTGPVPATKSPDLSGLPPAESPGLVSGDSSGLPPSERSAPASAERLGRTPLHAGLDPALPAAEPPKLAADFDPLLLGPPLFTQQNRPLDAPQYTPAARPATGAGPLAADPVQPAQFRGLGGEGELPSLEPVQPERLGDLPRSAPTHQPGKPMFGGPQAEPVAGGMPSGLGAAVTHPTPAGPASASGLPAHPGPAADADPFLSRRPDQPPPGHAAPAFASPAPPAPGHAAPAFASPAPPAPGHAGSSVAGQPAPGQASPGFAGQPAPGNAGPAVTGPSASGNAGPGAGQVVPGPAAGGPGGPQNQGPFLSRPAGQANQGPMLGRSDQQNAPRGTQPTPVNPPNPFAVKPDPQAAPPALAPQPGQAGSPEQTEPAGPSAGRPDQRPIVGQGQSPFLARPQAQPDSLFIPPAGPHAGHAGAGPGRPPLEQPRFTQENGPAGGGPPSGLPDAAPAKPTWPPAHQAPADDDTPSGLPTPDDS